MQSKLATLFIAAVLATASVDAAESGASDTPLQLDLSNSLRVGAYVLDLSSEQRRHNAVAMARSNQLEPAARVLEALHRRVPADRQVLFDLLSVLSWQGDHGRVVALADGLKSHDPPVYVLEAVAGSARRSANFQAAIGWYEIALKKEPANAALNAGIILSHADAGEASKARALFDASPPAFKRSLDGMLLDAYLLTAAGHHLQALSAYDRILLRNADNPEAQRGKFRALWSLLLVDQALEFAAGHPGVAEREDIHGLYVDRAALWVRWGTEPIQRGSHRFADLDRALDLLQQNRSRFPANTELGKTTRFDLIAALHARGRHDEVAESYDDLDLADNAFPAYALRAVAGSQLARREPEEALRLYDMALDKQPADFDLKLDRFFALVELDRHAQARELAEDLVFSQDIWLTVPGSRVVKPNPRRLKAEITRALSHAYADDLATAQSLFQDMLAEAPHNTDVRQELGNVYRWRGWPRRALSEYRQVYTVEDDLLSARVGLANSLLDLNMGREFEPLFAELRNEAPDNAGVKRLIRRHDVYRRNQVSVDAGGGTSSGEQFGSRQHLAEARLTLGGFGYNWRPFLNLHDSRAEFTEGTARRKSAGLGIQFRLPGHTLEAAASSSLDGESRTGFAFSYGWDIDDRWRLDGLFETESHALPLRAYRNGIDADRLRLAGSFRYSELRQVRAALEAMDFSDGNVRKALLLEARQRLVNAPRVKFDLAAEFFTSRNDLTDAAYFSPSSDRAFNLGGDLRWRMFRRYERNFDQQIILNAGRYSQSGFAAGNVGSIELRQVVQLSHALEFFFGVRRARALYDGGLEYGTFYQGGIRGRF
ncbi:MAG: poly-beta-1,6 N-acetyl-D-glucosamine export porin PgaA [Gammaproteobacteria bacterium]|nr:poly-beta-1,6 N-acetyl-D-glucosamine export porin PgaA [Gammaproteobacteria bacterium]